MEIDPEAMFERALESIDSRIERHNCGQELYDLSAEKEYLTNVYEHLPSTIKKKFRDKYNLKLREIESLISPQGSINILSKAFNDLTPEELKNYL